jgi:hypothetical protein
MVIGVDDDHEIDRLRQVRTRAVGTHRDHIPESVAARACGCSSIDGSTSTA